MKKIFILSILTLSVLMFSKCKEKKQDKIELNYAFTSEEHLFEINFPGSPEFFSDEYSENNLELINYIFMHNIEDKISYMLSITEYLSFSEEPDHKSLITSAMNSFNEEVGLEIENKEYINFHGFKAVEFVSSGNGLKAHLIDFYANSKLYQIGVLCNVDYFEKSNSDKFINSFKLIKK